MKHTARAVCQETFTKKSLQISKSVKNLSSLCNKLTTLWSWGLINTIIFLEGENNSEIKHILFTTGLITWSQLPHEQTIRFIFNSANIQTLTCSNKARHSCTCLCRDSGHSFRFLTPLIQTFNSSKQKRLHWYETKYTRLNVKSIKRNLENIHNIPTSWHVHKNHWILKKCSMCVPDRESGVKFKNINHLSKKKVALQQKLEFKYSSM